MAGTTYKNRNTGKKVVKNARVSRKRQNNNKKKKMAKNSYFSLMLDAKKKDLPSFVYNGKTFNKKTGKGNKSHLVYYSSS